MPRHRAASLDRLHDAIAPTIAAFAEDLARLVHAGVLDAAAAELGAASPRRRRPARIKATPPAKPARPRKRASRKPAPGPRKRAVKK